MPAVAPPRVPARRAPLRTLAGALLGWAPVWIPLVLLAQVGVRGLRPALAERARLEAEAPLVEERHRAAEERFDALELELRAWDDPVYRERRRRARMEGDAALAYLPHE